MEISKENLYIATEYFLGNKKPLLKKDKDYQNLFLAYATDKNSSSIREAVTLYYLGYESIPDKHGADGINLKNQKKIEVKPKYLEEGKKLGYSGNFNDMTDELLESKRGLNVVCSLFSRDRLIYIVEFPIEVIWDQLLKPIAKSQKGKRVVCGFGYNHYDSDLLHVHYYDKQIAEQYNCLTKNHIKLLESKCKS